MTDREKLIDLLRYANENIGYSAGTADYLIANGVAVQEWIPVKKRLPEPNELVLCIGTRGGMFIGYHCYSMGCSMDKSICFHVPNSRRDRYASHWLPLPKPPKEE